ncbi:DNA cytosine methyltransferase [Mucilaginibacter gynuensis]|uniref:DNA cytosine methyltransferase n=1 Tax=Mucilaginibacter gynuensis TaxID=1302236 RepID=UPI0031E95370
MKHASLFSGIGGFDLAAEWVGWDNIFHCEWNTFCQQVLKFHFPKSKSYDDITKTDFTIWRGLIDVLTGGFPCQPYSLAGQRKGKADERHLWPQMLRAIREIRPRWVVGENVFGLVNWNGGMVFNEVQADLEAEGYEVFPYVLPACAVNAPHRRDRVWFVAYARGYGHQSRRLRQNRPAAAKSHFERVQRQWFRDDSRGNGQSGIITNAGRIRSGKGMAREQSEQFNTNGEAWRTASDTYNIIRGSQSQIGLCTPWACCKPDRQNKIADADTRVAGWQEQHPANITGTTGHRPGGRPSSWRNWPTQSPVCDGNDGISSGLDAITFSKWRNESIKAGGNAIVPQVALQIFKAIEAYENMINHA